MLRYEIKKKIAINRSRTKIHIKNKWNKMLRDEIKKIMQNKTNSNHKNKN
jgi:hypothetical protein